MSVTPDKIPGQAATRHPWYPLVGHRDGLRMNDLVSLASAFWILANDGGTAHLAPIPGTIVDGRVVPVRL